jgi:diacylglycerol kinase (CTP)
LFIRLTTDILQIHRHEIPRKALHVSIGFVTLSLYAKGYQKDQIHPYLLYALIPVTALDILRHNIPSLNKVYVTAVGALMRESEVDSYNGVIWYIAGAWAALRFFPKDIGVMGILLLSWCDTAASTVGRLWGRYTPQIRRGKSFAGSAAALVVGIITAWGFWGWVVPQISTPNGYDIPPNSLAFQGSLSLPSSVKNLLGWKESSTVVSGTAALSILSVWSGIIASASEAVDLFHWDDNLTIPVLCGVGLYSFLKVFGNA